MLQHLTNAWISISSYLRIRWYHRSRRGTFPFITGDYDVQNPLKWILSFFLLKRLAFKLIRAFMKRKSPEIYVLFCYRDLPVSLIFVQRRENHIISEWVYTLIHSQQMIWIFFEASFIRLYSIQKRIDSFDFSTRTTQEDPFWLWG